MNPRLPLLVGAWALAASLLTGCQAMRNSLLYMPPGWTAMEQAATDAPDVLVERGTDVAARTQAVRARSDGYRLLTAAIGPVHARPVHYVCLSEACFQRFGGGSPRAKAFGDSRILSSPRGLSAADVAHEWWHAEFYARLGLQRALQVPRWFDEGVAVWVSADPRYGEAVYSQVVALGIVPPRLDELETFGSFDAAVGRYGDHLKTRVPDAVTVVYPTAAHEVRRWLARVGVAGLHELVAGLARGEGFQPLYAAIEARGSRPPP